MLNNMLAKFISLLGNPNAETRYALVLPMLRKSFAESFLGEKPMLLVYLFVRNSR